MTNKHKTACPVCNQSLRNVEQQLGCEVRCPRCHHRFVPTAGRGATVVDESRRPIVADTATHAVAKSKAAGDFRIGRFEVQTKLGHGGFGVVYQAHDPQLDRIVAIKVPTFGPDDKRRRRRFETEARSAARLHHPNIVTVYENGQAQNGQLYLATEFVRGRTLKDVIRQEDRTLREKVAWVHELADALAYAHSEGIVHRDIKPDNILIDDRHQRPRLADFGLAKVLNDSDSNPDAPMETQEGILGTPAFMAPEQARGTLSKVGPHSDQYSLGAVLYQCLTGQPPFSGSLYVVVAAVAGPDEPPAVRQLAAQTPVDLAAVCEKAMSKVVHNRYANVAAFGDDLWRWLRDEPVLARPTSGLDKTARWCRRNPLVAGLSGTLAAVMLLATIGLSVALAGKAAEERRALSNERKAVAAKEQAERETNVAIAARDDEAAAKQQAIDAKNKEASAKQEAVEAQQLAEKAVQKEREAKERAEELLAETRRQTERAQKAEDARDLEERVNEDLRLAAKLNEATNDYVKGVDLMATVPGHGLLHLARALGRIEAVETANEPMQRFEELLRTKIAHELPRLSVILRKRRIDATPESPRHVAFSADGSRVAIVSHGMLTVYSTTQPGQIYSQHLLSQSTASSVYAAEFGDAFCNGICFGGNNHTVVLCRGVLLRRNPNALPNSFQAPWQTQDSRIELHLFPPATKPRVSLLAPAVSGLTVWSAPTQDDKGVLVVGTHVDLNGNQLNQVYELTNNGITPFGPGINVLSPVVAVQRHFGNRQLRVASGMTIRAMGRTTNDLQIHQCQADIQNMIISPDQRRMATIQEHGDILLHTEGQTDPRTLPHDRHTVSQVAFSNDSRMLATACLDGTVRLWDVDTGQSRHLPLHHPAPVLALCFTGEQLCTVCQDRNVRLWRLPSAAPSIELQAQTPVAAEFSPSGRQILMIDDIRTGRILTQFDALTGAVIAENRSMRRNLAAAHYVGHGEAVVACEGAFIYILSAGNLEPLEPPLRFPEAAAANNGIIQVAASLDATRLVTLLRSGAAYQHTKAAKNTFRKISKTGGTCVAITADGRLAAVGTQTGDVHIVNTNSGDTVATFPTSESAITAACFSPQGDRLAIATQPAGVLLLNPSDGTRISVYPHPQHDQIRTIAFQNAGASLVSVSSSGIHMWNTNSAVKLFERRRASPDLVLAVNSTGDFLVEGTQVKQMVARTVGSAAEVTRMLEESTGWSLDEVGGLLEQGNPDQKEL